MNNFTPHIARGEHTRTLLILISVVAAVVVGFSAAPVPQANGSSGSYQWPIKPFDKPHPIRGSFGDPRTVFFGPPTEESLMAGSGKFNFHFGIDIWAPNGTAVYPVLSGTVSGVSFEKHREYVEFVTPSGRNFQYWHVWASVRLGQHVEAGKTVLGRIMKPFEHVHFAELRGNTIVNPLAPGHLTPYADTTAPKVASITLRKDERGPALVPTFVRGSVEMIAEAYDTRQMRIPGVWQPMPVAPARVAWQLQRLGGKAVAHGVAADFSSSIPSNSLFWSYYARGTYQNMSVFGPRYSWGQPGCFLFKLTRSPLDTTKVPDGVYDLVVTVSDIRGNSSSKALRLTVHNRAGW